MLIRVLDHFDIEEFYIKIPDKEKRLTLFRKNLTEIIKKLNIKKGTLKAHREGKNGIPGSIFIKLLKLNNLSIKDYEQYVNIKYGKFGKFLPFNLIVEINEDWFYITELIRTDGHISKNKESIKLVNTDRGLIDRFVSFMYKIGIKYVRIEENKLDFRALVFHKTLAELFVRIFKIQAGNKSLVSFIPKWMKNVDHKYIIPILKGAFDGEGSVQYTKGLSTRRVRLNTGSKIYARDIKYLLRRLAIPLRIIKDPRKDKNVFYVQISKKKNIEKFALIVGFNQKKRAEKLRELLDSYRWYTTEEIHNMVIEIIKTNPGITGGKIAKLVQRCHSTISSHLHNLEYLKLIKKIQYKQKKLIYPT